LYLSKLLLSGFLVVVCFGLFFFVHLFFFFLLETNASDTLLVADAQADLDPCWSQTHYVGFVVTQFILLFPGDKGLSWTGPYPPNDSPHYYYTLLYKQQSAINATELMYKYAGDCEERLAGRYIFHFFFNFQKVSKSFKRNVTELSRLSVTLTVFFVLSF
jgi:hypothetical protein